MTPAMPKPIRITTPRSTSEEVAKRYRIPKRRQRELEALARELVNQKKAELTRPESSVHEKEENRKDASAAD